MLSNVRPFAIAAVVTILCCPMSARAQTVGPPVADNLGGLLGVQRIVVLRGSLSWILPPLSTANGSALVRRYEGALILEDVASHEVRASIVTDPATIRALPNGNRLMTASYTFATTQGTVDNPTPGIPDGTYDLYCRYRTAERLCKAGLSISIKHTTSFSYSLGFLPTLGGAAPLQNVKVYYATDREVADAQTTTVSAMFKNDRSTKICPIALAGGEAALNAFCLNYGTLTPKVLNAPFAVNSPAPTLHELIQAINSNLPAKPQTLIIYIHGYNNRFDQAYMAASTFLAHVDSSVPVIFYSWPANGKTLKYVDDETNNTWSMTHFRAMLLELLNDSDAPQNVDIIAHSMGNRLLMDSLEYLQQSQAHAASVSGSGGTCILGSGDPATDASRASCHHIGQVISFEPDVDSATYFEGSERIAGTIPSSSVAQGLTLYGSMADYALELSRELHGHCRAGQLFCDFSMPIAPNVNVIDASLFRCDFFGHSYWDVSRTVESDLTTLIEKGVMVPNDPGSSVRPNLQYYQHGTTRNPIPHYTFTSVAQGDNSCSADPGRSIEIANP